MQFFSGLVALLILFCGSVNVCHGTLKEIPNNNTQTFRSFGDDRGRQGRPNSAVVDVVPTYSLEYRSPNKKDIKFTSGGIYQATILETTHLGTRVKCDLKMGVYAHEEESEVQFIITKGNEGGTFTVSARRIKSVKDFVFMDIETNKRLNRESVRGGNYLLTVEAQDPRTLAVLDTTELNVSVTDLNDNRPIFSRSFQHVTIDDDIPLHTSIAQVAATDADTGPNGWLYFFFSEKSSFFAIDPVSGVVTVTRTLAGKKRRRYELHVIAKDRIKVKSQHGTITEGKTGIRIAVIRVSDQDNANSDDIDKVLITSGNEISNFRVKRSQDALDEYLIEVVKPLDREKAPDGFDLVLTAFDKGVPPRNGTVSLHVLTEVANDMTPAFNQSAYAVTISELAPPHSSLMHVFAENGDSGENGRVYYFLSGGDSDKLMIDHDTGLITTNKYLDYETKPRLEFEVRSFDAAAVGGKMASVKVSVDIEDANDNDPVFDQPSYSIEIYEDLTPGTKLLTLRAHDEDSCQNGQIQYTIINIESVPFAIDSETGEITALTTLDRDSGLQEYITLRVRASDFGKPFRRESETYVHIRIKVFNDNEPVFECSMCKIQVNEDAPVGTILATLTAVDVDVAATSPLVYYIQTAGNEDHTFKIDPTSGLLKTDKSLQGGKQEFILYILVTDPINVAAVRLEIKVVSKQAAAGFSNYVKAQCQVSAEHAKAVEQMKERGKIKSSQASNDKALPGPANTNFPEFVPVEPVIDVSEDVAVGSRIAKLSANDKDQGFNGMVLYAIVSGNSGSSFKIDMYTGELCSGSLLDREKITNYTLNITASDCGSPVTKTSFTIVYINVLDVNDNLPIFKNDSYEVTLPENITIGQTVVFLKATDLDDGDNGRVRYQLVNDFGGKFRIDSKSGRLSVASALDYEDRPEYVIKVQAFDNSKTSQKITSAKVFLNLIDINDNAPAVVPKSFNVSIPEDIPFKSVVAAVSAQDPDTGLGGEIEFSLVGRPKKFKIDPGSGVIRLRRRVDYEQQDVYNLTVKISDKGTPVLTSYANVIITILDVNENNVAPKFSGGDLLEATVYENQPAMTTVMRLKASDGDSWYIKYAIIDGTGVDKFRVDPETAVITTTQVLRREEGDHYWLHVQAKDGEMYPLHTNVPMLIKVLAANDDPPYFNPPVYYPSVKENAKEGETVVTIQAHNPSSDDSSLMYSITQGNEAGKFAIDVKTGLIITTAALDREEQDFYELTVTVSDGSTPPQTASITFPVTVTDANDNDPIFLKTSYFAVVKEQSASLTPVEIFRVVAMDNDIGTNAELIYGIQLLTENNAGKVTINPKTGVISTRQAWVEGDYIDFEVNVTDGGTLQRSVSVYVSLDCEAKNYPTSNPPEFDKKSYKESLEEDAAVGTTVVVVSAFDLDDGDVLTYSISAGNTGNKFQIDSDLGEVTLVGKLDREEVSSFILTIQVSDDYNVDEATLIINILDVNDNSPQPVMTEYQAHISEDAKPGTLLTKVQAIDPDEGVNGAVNYAIVGSVKQKSRSLFKIQSSTGRIKTIKALDHEDMKEHTLIIKATDQGEPKRESLFSIVIAVDDVNDHKPVFLRSEFKAEVHVDASLGTSILKVFAVDGDDGTNAVLKFSMKGGNTNDAFYIDQNSGVIQVAAKLSSSIKKYYLQVQVSDSGTPAETAETEVQILVRGIKKPVMFGRPLYQASIVENIRPGHAIINVVFNGTMASYELIPQDNACWKDFHVNRKSGLVTNKVRIHPWETVVTIQAHNPSSDDSSLMYSITQGNEAGKFAIDVKTGLIITTAALDREEQDFYELTVTVSDGSTPPQTASITFPVTVTDANDNDPIFLKTSYFAVVKEQSASLTPVEIFRVVAMDNDIGTNAELIYGIQLLTENNAGKVTINPKTGVISTRQAWVEGDYIDFEVNVTDGGTLQRSVSVYVSLDCEAKNYPTSNPPEFDKKSYKESLEEDAAVGTTVVVVSAFDLDDGDVLTYSISAGNTGNKFQIDSDLGEVTLVGKLDREEVSSFILTIQVSDDYNVDEATLIINILDVNDNSPQPVMTEYQAHISEDAKPGTLLTKVQAIDPDEGVNGIVNYTIVGSVKQKSRSLFKIQSSTGRIKTIKALDREDMKEHTLIIKAADLGEPERESLFSVVIAVDDVNDHKPVFLRSEVKAEVHVDASLGTSIHKVFAVDGDDGTNALLKFSMKDGNTNDAFYIDQNSGVIQVASKLSSSIEKYYLQEQVSDSGTPAETAETEVQILVRGIKKPVMFERPTYQASIVENIRPGHAIINVVFNGTMAFYELIPQDNVCWKNFHVNGKSGLLTNKVRIYTCYL
ncbi:LOW QUALITY PROTEIN: protocadherin Fat 3-like [Orbicella faveolata]|uniref:LOW QUALITY PROTEIN: protocadherin Fat 3-like n=1 Tax=Orbicella faveolata TaxID=48498 RepID=UPI0009E520DF|nr:LOW QUALITY PROTEIN: protocadherin Fat 3-like [Orbicella faveolata]